MTTKVVLRILTADNALLGWTEIAAQARGDGCLWSPSAVSVVIEQDGVTEVASLHWCDMNVELRFAMPREHVVTGQIVGVYEHATPLFECGQVPKSLPAVTLRKPVTIDVPVGSLGVKGYN